MDNTTLQSYRIAQRGVVQFHAINNRTNSLPRVAMADETGVTEAQPPASRTASASNAVINGGPKPLCVDLDGTLILTDSLWESVLLLIKRDPRNALRLIPWLLRGKSQFKAKVAEHVVPDSATLPYCQPLIAFLKEQKTSGRVIVLATAANERIAHAVANHLKLFDEVLASTADTNLGGQAKSVALEHRFGKKGFDYVGNSMADLPLWSACDTSYIANASRRCLDAARAKDNSIHVFQRPEGSLRAVLNALRPIQWMKNSLVAAAIVLAHALSDMARLRAVALGIAAFCLCASAVYVLNDLLDLESDRHHPRKRYRPFASGAISIPVGLGMFVALLVTSFSIAILTGRPPFVGMLALYFVMSASYSLYFKQKLLVDVILLSSLYTHRIIAGAIVASVPITPWLLAFSMFLFLSLAFAKRYAELTIAEGASQEGLKGRNYVVGDLQIIESVGPASGYMAALVLCLYLNSELVTKLYHRPFVLWLVCPLLLYWITRLWFFARRRALVDDPLVFALTDRVSIFAAILAAIIVFAASI